MKDFVETERLIMHRCIFEEGELFQHMQKKHPQSSATALAVFIKKNKEVTDGIFGWWSDISSPYSAMHHIKEDDHLWRHKKQIQYYLYNKKTEKCIGIFCALIKENKADILVWLTKDAQRNGYAVEGAKAFEKELFLTAGVDAIQYRCYRHNPNKQRVSAFLKFLDYPAPKEDDSVFIWIKEKTQFLQKNGLIEKKICTATLPIVPFLTRLKMTLGLGRFD
ncbi:MAG: GNAT family N-acetyltransferase [Alphaproteobacteria bacterium]|nr:GNAT family N-acetyltransferase [Alphaproteobacteria bacterium]